MNRWKNTIHRGDSLEVMQHIPDRSIDSIICDLPYGTTACSWDNVIPFEPLWEQYNRIIKDNGAIVLFGSEPFSSHLRMSNIKNYKYDWSWVKNKSTGFPHSKNKPMKKHENISIFSKGTTVHKKQSKNRMCYNPQGLIPAQKTIKKIHPNTFGGITGHRPSHLPTITRKYDNYPHSVLQFDIPENRLHPTQKPVALLEYLIRTYTNENETVLDNTAGSFTTAIACIKQKRNYIMIEKDKHYFEIGKKRIAEQMYLENQRIF